MAEDTDQIELELETDVDTEVSIEDTSSETDSDVSVSSDDQFDKSNTATQKRIDRLTKKLRDAERRENDAVSYAKNVTSESNQLKQRIDSLDNSYVNEYSNRVSSQMEQAEKDLARAMDLGDTTEAVKVQRTMTSLAIENDRADQAKIQQERYKQQSEAQTQAAVSQPMPQQQPRRPDPKAETWAERNNWFGQDEAMTYAAFGIHKKLVEQEGFDPASDEYYSELDRQVADSFPHKFSASKRPRSVQNVASASRTNSGRSSGKKVRLTPSQVAIAKKLGVPLTEYAKYVKE
tara:strand:+ start:613 stop:1485 length:873 start_codon:yes stop_codon:yes gene_type:complete